MMADGATNVERCTSHVHVDWNLKVRVPDWKTQENVSHTFEIGNQSYYLMFLVYSRRSCLSLYRKGSPVQRSIRWRAGLKRLDGSYHHISESGDLNLEDDNRLSFEPYQLLEFYSCGCIKNSSHPESPCNVTVYFQVEVDEESAGTNACTQESPDRMFPPSDGQIYEKECSCCEHVEWTIDYDLQRESCYVSSVFDTGNQRFRFIYSGGSKGLLELFRLGSSVDDPGISVCCWAGLKRGDGRYHHRNKKHRLLVKNEYEVWRQVKGLMHFRHDDIMNYHLDQNKRLTFFLHMIEETGAEPCTFVCQVEEDWINSPERDSSVVVFKVEDMAFKIHKALIMVLVPVFKRMLTNECVESKTGVVTIEDCKAIVFKEFLELVEDGFRRQPSAENALALYEVANKYLLRHLKKMCSKRIKEKLSVDNFCDVLEFCIVYNDEKLLAFISAFLSRNRDITKSVRFSDVSSRYPDDINNLMRAVFPE